MTFLIFIIGAAIGFLIAYFLFNKPTGENDMKFDPLTPEEIKVIVSDLTNQESKYYIFKPGTKLKRRFESILDFVLMNLNKDTKRIILDDPVNFDSAIELLIMGEKDKDPAFKPTSEWIEEQRHRIENEKSYVFPELGNAKCPPPGGGGLTPFDVENNDAPWWTWFLNKYINVLHNYSVDIIGEIDNVRLIKPTIENREFTQFDKPSDLGDDGVQFALIIRLTNIKSQEEILIKYYIAFKD